MEYKDTEEEFTSASVICRICLIQNATYHKVFDDVEELPGILDLLNNFIGILIAPLDNWPKRICTLCLKRIQEFHVFTVRAKKNQERLAEIFGEYKEELMEVKFEQDGDQVKEEDNDGIEEIELEAIKDEFIPSDVSEKSVTRINITKILRKRSPKQKNHPDIIVKNENDGRTLRDKQVDAEIHNFFKMECVLCNIRFPRFTDVQLHFRKEHKRRGYVVCCNKKLLRPMKLYEHMMDHVNPTKHQCTICQKYYKSDQGLRVHKKLQHTPPELRKFRCDKCPQSFALISALTAHMISHMPPEEKMHKCETCGLAFALKTILAQHVKRVHENACVKVCEICAKVFRSKDTFEKHMGEHMNVQPNVPCTICGKMFKHRLAMQRHRYRHNTSGSLECPICQRVAANRQALHEHIKHNHRERKTFPCTICERNFKSRVSLKEHIASSHTGQVLYQCLFCSKQFNSNANYFRHNKVTHPVEWEAEKEKRRLERVNLNTINKEFEIINK